MPRKLAGARQNYQTPSYWTARRRRSGCRSVLLNGGAVLELHFLSLPGNWPGRFPEMALGDGAGSPAPLLIALPCLPTLRAYPDCLSLLASSFRPGALLRLPDRLLS
jgi:hypothetical protein